MRDSGTERSAEDAVGALPPDRLEAVVPKITTTILGGAPIALAPGDAGAAGDAVLAEADLAQAAQAADSEAAFDGARGWPLPRPHRAPYLEVVGAMAVIVALAFGDVRVGLLSGALMGAAVALRSIVGRFPFSFGEGFVGYRPDDGWPLGVQEDDDVRWNWKRPTGHAVPRQIPVTRALGGGAGVARR
jgi:hypothetical protein